MKQNLVFVILFLSLVSLTNARQKYNFNSDWKLYVGDADDAETPDFDDSDWKDVTTPHAWNEDEAFRLDIHNLSTGIAWYRKHFKVPVEAQDKKTFLEFEGIRFAGEFYLNGDWIGRSENGVMAFGFDVSDFVTPDEENVIAARIDNSWDYHEVETDSPFQWNDRNFYANYGGINKNVYLHLTDPLYQTLPLYSNLKTTGVYVYARDIDVPGKSANITAEAEVRNEYEEAKTFTYQVDIMDMEGGNIKTIKGQEYTLEPNETTIVSASAELSNLEFWSWGYGYLYGVHTSLSVDGEPVDQLTTHAGFRKTEFSHGMFKLNDRTLHLKGYAQRTTNEWPALGCAVPAWISDFSNQLVLDSHGSLIRWMHVTPWKQDVESLDRLGLLQAMPAGDSEGDVTGRRWEQRTELMRDAIIYNRNNPSVIFYESGNDGISEDHMSQMKDLRDTFDPHGGRASGSREMLDSKVAEYGGEMLYINKGADIPFWAMEYSRDEGLRKYWDNWSPPYHQDGDGPPYDGEPAPAYNHNQDTHAIEDVRRWFDYFEQRPGTGTRVNAGGVNIVFSDTNTHHRGESNYRTSGEVDAVRLPKDNWYAHQAMWNNWVDIEKLDGHIIGHWNYNDSTVKDVYVVSTADEVELFLNDESLGMGEQSSRFLFTFSDVTWQSGELRAVGYSGGNDGEVLDSKTTTGDPVGIRLTPHVSPSGFVANGADIALVDVEVVDEEDRRVPIALNTIDFTLSGEATWRGGIAKGPDNCILATSLPVENGVNRVLIRSTTEPGEVTLVAESDGLESTTITLNTEPFTTQDGLSTVMPGSNLTSNLSRGPTPSGESYTVKRKAIEVQDSTAGCDQDNTGASYDDNETSEWACSADSDSKWITYSWDGSANVTQIALKLPDFRTTEYPVVVEVDDEVVFDGTAEKNLGYATLDLDPAVGESVTITMDKDDDIGIIEAEIYTPP